jgi:hypothetical protein
VTFLGPLAVVALLGSIAVKWFLATRVGRAKRRLRICRNRCRQAKKEMGTAVTRAKFLAQEEERKKKQIASTRKGLSSLEKRQGELLTQQAAAAAASEKQGKLIRGRRH